MNEKTAYKPILAFGILFILTAISLSGCVNNQNTGNDSSKFIGTWTGEKEISMFGGRSSSITQLTITQDTVQVTLTSDQGSFTMDYNYTLAGNTLTLEPKFNGGRGFAGGQPYNGTGRPDNSTFPHNGTGPWNGTQPPGNRNNSNGPQNGGRPSMTISFDYSFSEDDNVLYLDESRFIRV